MNKALAAWVNRLDQTCLPALHENIERMRQLAANEDVDITSLAALIESDPGLTLRLMRYINNLRHKHLRSEITTVRNALMMLGLSHVQQIPEGIATVEELDEAAGVRLRRHFSQALHAAYQARDWARVTKDLVSDELYLAALLHNLGETLLDLHAPQEMARMRELIRKKQMEANEAEYVVFGFTIVQLTAELTRLWHLPALLLDSLHGENAQHRRTLNVMLAAQIARAAERGWYTPRCNKLIEQTADLLFSDPASVASLLHRNAVEAARRTLHLGVSHPALLLLNPPPAPVSEESIEPQRPSQPVLLPEGDADFCLMPQRRVLLRVMKGLSQETEKLSLKQVLKLTMEGMREGLGLNRVVFAMITPDKAQLRARGIIGAEDDPQFNRFVIDLEDHNLFVRLLEKPQSLWLDENNRARFLPHIPENFYQQLRNDSFFIMSLFVRNKPIGVFYADRHSSACRLDAESYKRFKQLVTQASQTLSRIL
jgi:HD-like signal output (HDOD) protein